MSAEKNIMRPRGFQGARREPSEFEEKVVEVQRISRVVKGGRRIRFRALVVIGNRKGKVGMGVAKANDVSDAVRKAVSIAKKHIIEIPIIDGTIPYAITLNKGSVTLMLKPASTGTSIVAGGSIRIVAELAGITDILAKSLGSSNKINNVTTAIAALDSFRSEYVDQIRKMAEKKSLASTQSKKASEQPAAVESVKTEPSPAEKPEKKEAPKKAARTKGTLKKNS